MKPDAEFDLVLFAASGFVGQLIAEHLAQRKGAPPIRWAMAGRDMDRLRATRDAVGAGDVELIAADSNDPASLDAMVARTRAVMSAAGPFMAFGTPVVAACARSGTDYLDVNGEICWTNEIIGAYDAQAKASGARMLPCCGFDSVPTDLAIWLLQREAQQIYGHPLAHVKGRVMDVSGSFSGGTAETVRQLIAAAGDDPFFLAMLGDPFALTPGFQGPDQPSPFEIRHDPDIDAWVGPFKMAPLNIANVHRTNLLEGHVYGREFVYDEMVVLGDARDADEAAAQSAAHGWSGLDMLAGEDVPAARTGPSREERRASSYDILYYGIGDDGRQIRVLVHGDEDAGYGSTAKIAAETARCLLLDGGSAPAGFLTPAVALGQALVDRLAADAGLTFRTEVKEA